MNQYGYTRVNINESTGIVQEVNPSTRSTNTKEKGWTDIRYIKIPFKSIKESKYVYKKYGTVPNIAKENSSEFNLWINASYVYDATILGKTIIDGKITFPHITGKTENRKYFYFKNGIPEIGKLPVDLTGIKYAANVGPLLLDNGIDVLSKSISEDNFQSDIITGKNNRTLVGITSDSYFVIVIVDGRGSTDAGLTLKQCVHLLKYLGCVKGINLDGGASGTIHSNNKQIKDFINLRNDTHLSDMRLTSPSKISHAIGFSIDMDKFFPYRVFTATATAKIIDGAFHIPARSFIEALGGTVTFDQTTLTGTFILGNKTIKLTHNSDKIIVFDN